MSRLKNVVDRIFGKEPKSEPVNEEITPYNRLWLKRISDATGFIPNDDRDVTDEILAELNENGGYCPCGGSSGEQFTCPCVVMRDKGICKCGLFNNVKPIEPRGLSRGRVVRSDQI